MQVTLTRKPKNTVELEVEIDAQEFRPYLDRAAARLSSSVKIPGFRPGKVPADVIREKLGAKTLLDEAAEEAAKGTYPKVVKEQNLTTVGPPKIEVLMLAEGNPFRYRATAAVLPEITLAPLEQIKAVRRGVKISEEDLQKALGELQDLRRSEKLSLEPAKKGDKVEIDLEVFRDGIPLDGGQSKQHPIIIGSASFIPGFEEQLIGLAPGQTKDFTLTFPLQYHQKNLAGKPAQFKIKVNNVFHLERPPLNDDFAKNAGPFKNLDELQARVRENLLAERTEREEQRLEGEIMDALIKASQVGEIPDLLIGEETDRMLDELEHDITERGMKMDDYLTHLKKSREELKKEFAKPAERRIKSALLMRELARQRNVTASREEIERERTNLKEQYAEDPAARSRLDDEEVTRFLATRIVNRKIIDLLKLTVLTTPRA